MLTRRAGCLMSPYLGTKGGLDVVRSLRLHLSHMMYSERYLHLMRRHGRMPYLPLSLTTTILRLTMGGLIMTNIHTSNPCTLTNTPRAYIYCLFVSAISTFDLVRTIIQIFQPLRPAMFVCKRATKLRTYPSTPSHCMIIVTTSMLNRYSWRASVKTLGILLSKAGREDA